MAADYASIPAANGDDDPKGASASGGRLLRVQTPATATSPGPTPLHHPAAALEAALTPESLVEGPAGHAAAGDATTVTVTDTPDSAAGWPPNSPSDSAGQRPLPIMSQAPPPAALQTSATPRHASGSGSGSAPAAAIQPAVDKAHAAAVADEATPTRCASTIADEHDLADRFISAASPQSVQSTNLGATDQPQPGEPHRQGPGPLAFTNTRSPSAPGQHHQHVDADATNSSTPLTEEFPPLHISSVRPGTKIAHPRPIALPSPGTSTPLPTQHQHQHQLHNDHLYFPEQGIRSSAFVGNVAQLEATAESLSTGTSSIGDAIRDLHGELKRSDSQRSSILASQPRAQNDELLAHPPPVVGQLKRHLSNSSSIVPTNIAARHGGYSPGGFVMSPNHSLTGRLRSGSKNSSGRPDFDTEPVLTRHGPGKTSVRSVRSTKLSLAEISESEPTSLTKDALDAADVAPPIEDDIQYDDPDDTIRPIEQTAANVPNSDSFRQMLDQRFETQHHHGVGYHNPRLQQEPQQNVARRASARSARSVNTFQQAQDVFGDFDGVHWEPEPGLEPETETEQPAPEFPTPHMPLAHAVAPQPYTDPETGQQMLYYPVPVPAMLNLPPKLSTKPKAAAQHNNRRSHVLSAMADTNRQSEALETKRRSGVPDVKPEAKRDSFLPDPLAGHRDSFHALTRTPWYDGEGESVVQAESLPDPETATLRRPQRLSRAEGDNSKPRASRLQDLPPQLRASAFFDLPPVAPEMEVKDSSAMATLDNMLDASTRAPVSAFTNHAFGGELGDEVYGKEKKHKHKVSWSSRAPETAGKESKNAPKKRLSKSWFRRRSNSSKSEKSEKSEAQEPNVQEAHGGSGSVDGESVRHQDDDRVSEGRGDEESDDDGADVGQPVTLLAELQRRKQQQKERTKRHSLPDGPWGLTLLEKDAIAETQRKNRRNKRVNLAWEDPNAHLDQNGTDDEDVPLGIVAAKQRGAKNMADLERPMGLMERQELEDNEPLSHRKARLLGLDPKAMGLPKRQSIATLSAHLGGHARGPSNASRSPAITPEPEEPEFEDETLAERKRRLEAKQPKQLPTARPVSNTFSTELLSQFGDLDDSKSKPAGDKDKENSGPASEVDEEEETLGQRKKRLQAEKEARAREMSYSNLVGQSQPAVNKRSSMADMLSAYPRRGNESRAQMERQRIEQAHYAAAEREAKMAAMRKQMPTSLNAPGMDRAGGFRGGVYNDGRGGLVAQPGQPGQPTPAVNTQGAGHMQGHNRSTTAMSAYGMPMQQAGHAPSHSIGFSGNMGGYNTSAGPYGRGSMQLPLQMEMTPQMSASSINRVEQWRHGVMP